MMALSQMNPSTGQEFLIVAIGASAGGLEALEKFFGHMPADAGMGFVVIQHLAPDHASVLAQLLARYTEMPVEQVQNHTEGRARPGICHPAQRIR